MRIASVPTLCAVLLCTVVASPVHAGAKIDRMKALARNAGLRLVPTRVARNADGTVVLTRWGKHDGRFDSIERVTGRRDSTLRETLKISIVDGDEREMTVRETISRSGIRTTLTRRAGESSKLEMGRARFQPLTYRRALLTAILESPITKTAALAAATSVAAAINGELVEKIVSGGPTSEALRQATIWAAERGALIGGVLGAGITLGSPHTTRTQVVTHHPEVVTAAWTEIEEK